MRLRKKCFNRDIKSGLFVLLLVGNSMQINAKKQEESKQSDKQISNQLIFNLSKHKLSQAVKIKSLT